MLKYSLGSGIVVFASLLWGKKSRQPKERSIDVGSWLEEMQSTVAGIRGSRHESAGHTAFLPSQEAGGNEPGAPYTSSFLFTMGPRPVKPPWKCPPHQQP